MSRTNKDKPIWTKKELVTDPLHRKAGPHNKKDNGPKVCPDCRGACVREFMFMGKPGLEDCGTCKGEGIVYV